MPTNDQILLEVTRSGGADGWTPAAFLWFDDIKADTPGEGRTKTRKALDRAVESGLLESTDTHRVQGSLTVKTRLYRVKPNAEVQTSEIEEE